MLDRVKDVFRRYKNTSTEVGDKAYVVASSNSEEEKRALNSVNAKYLAKKEKVLAKKEKILARKEARLREMQESRRVRSNKSMIRKLEYFDEYDVDEMDESDIDVFAGKNRFMYDPLMGFIDDPFMSRKNRKRDRAIDLFDF